MCVGAKEAPGGFWSRRLISSVLPVKRIILATTGKKTDDMEKLVMTDIARLIWRWLQKSRQETTSAESGVVAVDVRSGWVENIF